MWAGNGGRESGPDTFLPSEGVGNVRFLRIDEPQWGRGSSQEIDHPGLLDDALGNSGTPPLPP